MKIKYAIYKNDIGLRAIEYADTIEGIKDFPYIKESSLPVVINSRGGYSSFDLEFEKEIGFVEIIEVDEDADPLTREQMFPKNSQDFDYGWIDLEGNTYNTGYEGHNESAVAICKELGYTDHYCEYELENRGWIKITAESNNIATFKIAFAKDSYITKKQADSLFDLGLWEVSHVPYMIKRSENSW